MRLQTFVLVAVAIVCTILPIAGHIYGDRGSGWLMVDFRSYYCAALTERRHLDPYLVHPLHECESSTPRPYYRAPKNVTVPAPYPPYVLMIISPITLLPFQWAAIAWGAFMAAMCALTMIVLSRITQLPILVSWAALALSLGLESLPTGQIVPLCIAALALAGLFVQRGRPELSALAVTLAMFEPHVALPAAVALFIRYRASRLVLLTAFAFLAIVSITFAGPAQNVEYITKVLPAHALAEVSRDNQYSLSTVVASFGVRDTAAVAIGNVSYAIMLLIGVILALRLAHRFAEPSFLVLVPPALTLLGGPFVHTAEIAAAVPACLLLVAHVERHRGLLTLLLIALAIPWIEATSVALFLAPLFPAAILAYLLVGNGRVWALSVALVSACIILPLFLLAQSPAGHEHFIGGAHPTIDPRLAESSWRALVLSNSTNRPVMWLLRLPTWLGLTALAAVLVNSIRLTSPAVALPSR
jgi:hypothetical protein